MSPSPLSGVPRQPAVTVLLCRCRLLSTLCWFWCSRRRLDGQQAQEILEINVRPGWRAGTKITFAEKGVQRVLRGALIAQMHARACQPGCLLQVQLRWFHCVCASLLLTRHPSPPHPHTPTPAGDEHPGRIAADVVFVVQERPHPMFQREGNDLVYVHRCGGPLGGGGGALQSLSVHAFMSWPDSDQRRRPALAFTLQPAPIPPRPRTSGYRWWRRCAAAARCLCRPWMGSS